MLAKLLWSAYASMWYSSALYFKSVYRYRALIMRVFDERVASAKI